MNVIERVIEEEVQGKKDFNILFERSMQEINEVPIYDIEIG